MRIRQPLLFLGQSYPYPPRSGVTNRTFNVVRQLQKEFDVSLVAFSRRDHQPDPSARLAACEALKQELSDAWPPVPIRSEWSLVRRGWDHIQSLLTDRPYTDFEYWSRAFESSLRHALQRHEPRLVHLDSLDLHSWASHLSGIPITCTHHSIESELLRQQAGRLNLRLLAGYVRHQADLVERVERDSCPSFALNIMMSDLDGHRLRHLAPGSRTLTVANGVDVNTLMPVSGLAPIRGRLVFVGPTYSFPNRDAVEFLLSEIWPEVRRQLPWASLDLVGRGPSQVLERFGREPGVQVLGELPDLRRVLGAASCAVVPIRTGGGTRLKILDAWAMGKAVVSTSIGCEGLAAIDGANILIRDDPSSFADAVVTVLTDSDLRTQLSGAARTTAVENYSWDVIGSKLRAAYQEIAAAA